MLKYTVNIDKGKTDLQEIDVIMHKMIPSDTIVKHDAKNTLKLEYKGKQHEFHIGDKLYVQDRIDITNDNGVNDSCYTYSGEYPIISVDKSLGTMTISVNRFFDLSIDSVTAVTDEDGNESWFFYFSGNGHLFNKKDDGKTDEDSDDYDDPIHDPILYIEYRYITDDGIIENGLSVLQCSYVSPNELSCPYNDGAMGKLKASIFNGIEDGTDDDYITDGSIDGITIYRETPLFTRTNNVRFFIDNVIGVIDMPISMNFNNDLYQDDSIVNQYVSEEKEKSLNRIVDMERDVYHPVVWDSMNDEYVGDINKEADKIVFNLHFRQHRGADWIAATDSYWNGCKTENGKISLIDDYFSYGVDYASRQSDLISYLGFKDTDVRFQKNKLSRSFIRIMFYDSMNPADQNLLYYSTIFIDSGLLFGKYIKYIENSPYRIIDYNGEVTNDLVGIKVNREPYGEQVNGLDLNGIEELRLSSQLVVQDKYQSKGSSDGFYLYLWKDNDNGVTPTDIYMKVEFNHAAYGRSIPFMMPFWDPNKTYYTDANNNIIYKNKKIGIKSYQEILDDWNMKEGSDMQYGSVKYAKYSYIHFKYKYDKVHNRHIYYLDDTFYGNGVHFDDNVITLNLYEAKLV